MTECNIKETVAKNLLYYRKKNKITQKELAEQLGVKHNAISSWENGVNSIDIDTLFRVCKIFGVTVNDMYSINSDSGMSLSIPEQEHVQKYRSLDSFGRETVDIVLEREVRRVRRLISYSNALNAAHERTDIEVTDEMRRHDDDIMNDDSEWE